MADTAWTTIRVGDGEDVTVIEAGDSVSPGDVGGDEFFDQLKESGAIREADYPEDVAPNESVRERNVRVVSEKMEELQAQGFDTSDVDVFPTDVPVAVIETEEVEPPKKAASKSSGSASDS
jgi:hypothetical protein